MTTQKLVIALPKGKLFKPAIELLAGVGINCTGISDNARQLLFNDAQMNTSFILAKPWDIPTYVEHGAADLGIVGSDVIQEQQKDVYELVDLKFGQCKLVVALPQRLAYEDIIRNASILRIGTKYPRITEQYFRKQGLQVEVIKLSGSIELSPLVGLAEIIVDIVSTGQTLRENDLQVAAEIAPVSTRLIANRVSYQMKTARINWLIEEIRTRLSIA